MARPPFVLHFNNEIIGFSLDHDVRQSISPEALIIDNRSWNANASQGDREREARTTSNCRSSGHVVTSSSSSSL